MRSGFFNSEIIGYDAEGMPVFDRAEEASFFAKYFSQFISNGVFPSPSTNMQVLATQDMKIKVDIGVCYINGYMGWVEPPETFVIEESDMQSRIDRVVARLDFTDKSINLFVKKGISAGNPIAPELQRDYDIFEIGLADIRVNANVIEIKQENITDLRLNAQLCGIVANQLQHVDTTTLFNQYQDWLQRITKESEDDIERKRQEFECSLKQFETNLENIKTGFSNNLDNWLTDVKKQFTSEEIGKLYQEIVRLRSRNPVVISQTQPEYSCIWFQVVSSNTVEDNSSDILLETADLDGTEIYTVEVDEKKEKITNIKEELEQDEDIVLEIN